MLPGAKGKTSIEKQTIWLRIFFPFSHLCSQGIHARGSFQSLALKSKFEEHIPSSALEPVRTLSPGDLPKVRHSDQYINQFNVSMEIGPRHDASLVPLSVSQASHGKFAREDELHLSDSFNLTFQEIYLHILVNMAAHDRMICARSYRTYQTG